MTGRWRRVSPQGFALQHAIPSPYSAARRHASPSGRPARRNFRIRSSRAWNRFRFGDDLGASAAGITDAVAIAAHQVARVDPTPAHWIGICVSDCWESPVPPRGVTARAKTG